ncbi:hypothetical protein PHMEG_00028764 [Phytophthora megakarya]|uniref:Bzip transcription factor n=1 Tax=Phytophthora megakarya TaxID=4795 RepID=A0A225V3Q2_9STRA|nr:hypothetical protein PHMEG_00028764 [Phytophthora megakarya]
MVVDALERKIRHREYSRACQARHREKEKMYEADLQGYITKLQCEIKALELKVQDISRSPNITNIWAIAAEYATYFNDYVSSPDTLHATASSFLHGIMAPDVAIGSEFGVEAQLETWKLFALYFADVHLELKGMDMSTTHTLAVRTIISVTITRNTLCRAFPHLSHDGPGGTKGSKWSPLANRLLGQKLVMRGSALFGWNNAIHP